MTYTQLLKNLFFVAGLLFTFQGMGQVTLVQDQLQGPMAGVEAEPCGFDQLHQEMMELDPVYRERTIAFNDYARTLPEGFERSLATYKVPVVVHVMETGNHLTAITDEQIRTALRAMNERFRKVTGTPGFGSGVDVGIEFVLAVRDPSGNCTSGINRVNMSWNPTYMASGVFRGSVGVPDAELKGYARWDQTKYYNIWAVSEIDNNNGGLGVPSFTGGYAYFASAHGLPIDGTVMLVNQLRDPSSTTLTHELGHALNVFHTFEGDGTGGTCPPNATCATQGDLVCDTPPHRRSISDCNTGGLNSCDGNSSNLLFVRNYMDYSAASCQNMFSAGQATRMVAALTGLRASYLAANGNNSLVPPAAPSLDITASTGVVCGAGQSVTLFVDARCLPNTFLPDSEFPNITYSWTLSNGVSNYNSTNQNPTFTLATAGTYNATLSVTTPLGTYNRAENGVVVVTAASATVACTPTSANGSGSFGFSVNRVKFNTIDHSTSPTVNGIYQNFVCSRATSVNRGSTYTLTVTINSSGTLSQVYEAYIDWNNNGSFADAGELVASGSSGTAGATTFNTPVTIPVGVTSGSFLRMRIYGDVVAMNANKRNCTQALDVADVEDYGVYVATNVAAVFIAVSGNPIGFGTPVTFTPVPANGGTPSYVWFRNGVQVGTGATYVSSNLMNGDQVYCTMASTVAGVIGSPATSNVVSMSVNGIPQSEFLGQPRSVCVGGSVSFFDQSLLGPTAWNWNFAGGTPASSLIQNPTITYNFPGTWNVALTATNSLGTSPTLTKSGYIKVYNPAPAACTVTRTNDPGTTGIGIFSVSLNTIGHFTAWDGPVMNNYSCSQITTLEAGTTYPIVVSVGPANPQWVRVYIDYNNNGSFIDPGELVFFPANGTGDRVGSFTTPTTPAVPNTLLRMRVISDFISTTPGPCTTPLSHGQVEDYGVVLNPAVQTITTGTISGSPFCSGAAVSVPYTAVGTFTAGNIFTAQLSNSAGSFASPTSIGTLSSTASGTISATIPGGTATGSGYRIRVVSSTPVVTGTDNGVNLTINAAPSATISYPGTPFCASGGTITVTRTGTAGGSYSSTPGGLSINSSTGAVSIGASMAGAYNVTYTVAASGGCLAFSTSTSFTITAPPGATISYAGSPFCTSLGTVSVTRTGTAGGGYSASPAGLSINSSTGAITPGTSTAGTYNVTYTIVASGGCAAFSTNTSVSITAAPNATISYTGSPYCIAAGTATVTRTGTLGGSFAASPAGLSIASGTGTVTLGTSTPGTYTVTLTIPAAGGCALYTTTTSITVQPDTDGDGICDPADNCPTVPGQIGSPCDDGDPNTINDVLNASCVCVGTVALAGDNVCGALPLVVGTNGPYSNVGATTQPGEPVPPGGICTSQMGWCSGQTISHSVWFTFVAPSSGRVSINFGATSNWDSQIAVWSAADCNAILSSGATLVAANDDHPGGPPYSAAILPICVTPGVTYFVQVDGYSTLTNGAFQLVLTEEPASVTGSVSATPAAVCAGASANVTFTGTEDATVTYTVNGGAPQTGILVGGALVVITPPLLAPAVYTLTSVSLGACTQVFPAPTPSTSVVIDVVPSVSLASVTANPSTVCAGSTAQLTAAVVQPPLQVTINGTGFWGDELSWSVTNSLGQVLASGGSYGFGVVTNVTIPAPTMPPYTFSIETQGIYNDNQATYTLRCDGAVILTNTILGGAAFSQGGLDCQQPFPLTYSWTPAGSVVNAGAATTSTTAMALNTNFEVTVTAAGGCSATGAVGVVVNPTPVISGVTASPPAVCAGGSSQLQALANGAVAHCSGPFYTQGCGFGDMITQVTFAGISRSSACDSPSGYSLQTAQQATVVAGTDYSFTMATGPLYAQGGAAWVDWDQDGLFEPEELIVSGLAGLFGASYTNGAYTVPLTARNGRTRLRVRCTYAANPSANPCGQVNFGEVEDYYVNVTGGQDGLTYAWSPAGAMDNAAVSNPVASNIQPVSTYTVVVSNPQGCTASASVNIGADPTDTDGDGVPDCTDNCPFVSGVVGGPCNDGNPGTINDMLDANCNCIGTPSTALLLSARVILDGAYDAGAGLMRDNLRALPAFPLAHPYGGAPFGHPGIESVTLPVLGATGDNAIVDWVIVELRDNGNPAIVVASAAGLVQRDGDIVSTNGVSPLSFTGAAPGPYRIAIRHRNHLGVMTLAGVPMSGTPAVLDFTQPALFTFGTTARKTTSDGKLALWPGNVNPDNLVKYLGAGDDRDPVLSAIGGTVLTTVLNNVYHQADVTMNGEVKYLGAGDDRDPILSTIGGVILNSVRLEQLP